MSSAELAVEEPLEPRGETRFGPKYTSVPSLARTSSKGRSRKTFLAYLSGLMATFAASARSSSVFIAERP